MLSEYRQADLGIFSFPLGRFSHEVDNDTVQHVHTQPRKIRSRVSKCDVMYIGALYV